MAWKDKDGNVYITSNPGAKEVRMLTREEIEKYSKKQWKEQDKKPSDDPVQAKRNKNLTGPKTEEGRRRALQNLRPVKRKKTPSQAEIKKVPGMTHGATVKSLLNDDERDFFELRMGEYFDDFDINESSDMVLLVMTIMEEVVWRRLMLYQFQNPTKDVNKQITDCQDRLRKNLETLGMTRKQRIGDKVNVEASISDLNARFIKELEMLQDRKEAYLREEKEVLERQRKRKESNDSYIDEIGDN